MSILVSLSIFRFCVRTLSLTLSPRDHSFSLVVCLSNSSVMSPVGTSSRVRFPERAATRLCILLVCEVAHFGSRAQGDSGRASIPPHPGPVYHG